MPITIYHYAQEWEVIAILRDSRALFKYLAATQVGLKETWRDEATQKVETIFNNAILDSVNLGDGKGNYLVLSEYGSLIDPRNYYVDILKYRQDYIYAPWYRAGILRSTQIAKKPHRQGPVEGCSHRRNPKIRKSYGFKHLLREVTHEDYLAYNRDHRRLEILEMGGGYYSDRDVRSTTGDRCWKQKKIKRQYDKHR